MSVLVDTSVWSLALRRRKPHAPEAAILLDLISRRRAQIIGAVRQEVLSGIRDRAPFERLRDQLRTFPDHPLRAEHHERTAELLNLCRSRGMQGANVDFSFAR